MATGALLCRRRYEDLPGRIAKQHRLHGGANRPCVEAALTWALSCDCLGGGACARFGFANKMIIIIVCCVEQPCRPGCEALNCRSRETYARSRYTPAPADRGTLLRPPPLAQGLAALPPELFASGGGFCPGYLPADPGGLRCRRCGGNHPR